MSSEMRECPFCGNQPRSGWQGAGVPGMDDCGYWGIDCCNAFAHADTEAEALAQWNRRALLARTEAGADGAAMAALERESDKSMGVGFDQWFANPYTAVLLKSIAEDYVPRTHPQDASGDAEFSAAELESLAKCVQASVTPGGFHIPEGWNVLLDKLTAMQAKEAR